MESISLVLIIAGFIILMLGIFRALAFFCRPTQKEEIDEHTYAWNLPDSDHE